MDSRGLDPDRLFTLRLVVARCGELDANGWWNTKGQLGNLGRLALRRGFPKTASFAQARSVFAVAAARCREVFDPPETVTLWQLPPAIEEQFDAKWEHWLDHAGEWSAVFDYLSTAPLDLTAALRHFDLVDASHVEAASRLRRSAEGRAVPLPGTFSASWGDVALLALGFVRGERNALAVPYQRRGDG